MKSTKQKSLTVDAGVIASLGRNSIKDHTTAIIELVKNSYDAGAKIVDIEIMNHLINPYIRIADNGQGMTEQDIDASWLRIGYSEKRKVKFTSKRRKTGEKGIGRLSADRLGAVLEMRTLTPRQKPISIIIDWNKYNQTGKNIEDIKFDFFEEDVEIRLPTTDENTSKPKSGTELIIRELRQEWVKEDFEELYKQLSMLLSPFDNETDFDLRLKTSEEGMFEKISVPEVSNYFEVKLEAIFDPASSLTTYKIWERVPGQPERVELSPTTIEINQLVTNNEYDLSLEKNKLGPVKVILYYYTRSENILFGSNFSKSQLSTYLKESSGIKLYRDNIRVKPYGEPNQPGGDWLNLGARVVQNPAGRGRPDHRIRPNQLVGALFISRDSNPLLNDSSSREGLIQDDTFKLLYDFTRGCIKLVEARSHDIFIREEKSNNEEETVSADLDIINKNLSGVHDDLQDVSKVLTQHEDSEIRVIGETVATLVEKIDTATKSIEAIESQTRLYRALATVGIASAVFGHETLTQISRMSTSLYVARDYLNKVPPRTSQAILKIDSSIIASDRVLAWGGFALDRIRRDKREIAKCKISDIISLTLKDLRGAFDALDIKIDDKNINENIESFVYKIDIESITLNLLTNAYTACRQSKQIRVVEIALQEDTRNKQKGFSLTVSDSGPGVNENLRKVIWEPTFTTKSIKKGASEEGTGMGLAIISGIVEEMNGTRKVEQDSKLGGAKFEIWLPLVSLRDNK